jgi:hypothetical protein
VGNAYSAGCIHIASFFKFLGQFGIGWALDHNDKRRRDQQVISNEDSIIRSKPFDSPCHDPSLNSNRNRMEWRT